MYDAILQMLFACVCVHTHVAMVQYAHDAVYVYVCIQYVGQMQYECIMSYEYACA